MRSVRRVVRRDCCAERVEMWDEVWEARVERVGVVEEEGVWVLVVVVVVGPIPLREGRVVLR